ncbi:GNAT family N-acetyltransferase [Zooshikella marina]|uniref:GNAT family N-acetyltransferase n=1 Tax=Zooshikella ganghwensis TaxID=202772 RepID=A0A4P9VN38_9GAMM|nr:GNAT family N-acetyltransferase [Zooshikella ganghwensis]MBU2705182.1 GNAT family N-acetyltransferase [Zooshikella ganghwensis]RDH44316.1 GNAT family N-acetyltransferase [Zooshikella ganghwensis]
MLTASQHADQLTILEVGAEVEREARSLLFHSYSQEPAYQYLLNAEKTGYEQRVRAVIRETINLHFSEQQPVLALYKENRVIGFAFILTPLVTADLYNHFRWRWRMILTAGFSATERFLDYRKQVESILPKQPLHRLAFIAVHPQQQHQGYGLQFMTSIHDYCAKDKTSAGIVLDTGNPRYVTFFEKMGYQRLGNVHVGDITEHVFFRPVTQHETA